MLLASTLLTDTKISSVWLARQIGKKMTTYIFDGYLFYSVDMACEYLTAKENGDN